MSQDSSSLGVAAGKLPSVMRYDRVQAILEADDAIKAHLGPKDQEVTKRNGEKHRYTRGVFLVTNILHERHFDAHNVDKNMVLGIAFEVLIDKPQKIVPPKPVAKPAPPPPPKPVVEVKKPEPKPEPKPKAIRPQAPKKSVPQTKAPAKPGPAAVPPAPVPAPVAPAEQKPGFVYYIYGTALSHAVTIYKTLEIGDRSPGAEARLDTVSKLIDQLKPLANTAVPMPEDFNNALKHAKTAPNPKG